MNDGRLIYVIDDDDAVRDSLGLLLSAEGFAVETFASARSFLKVADSLVGGCILSDVRMPEMDGLELLTELRRRGVKQPLIMMTGHGDVPLAVQAMKAGALDFLEKPFEDDVLLNSLRNALARNTAADGATDPRVVECLASLTPREHEVLVGLVKGLPNKSIAYDLGISPRTVEIHRARVMEKMAASSLAELVRMALGAGLLGGGR